MAWTRFLLEAAGVQETPEEIAGIAHQAEVVEFGEPGGMMDHYTSALGGILWIDTKTPVTTLPLRAALGGFVIGDTMEEKDTLGTLASLKRDVHSGLEILKRRLPGSNMDSVSMEEIERFTEEMPGGAAERLRSNLRNRSITPRAKELLSAEQVDGPELGRLLSEHQRNLRDGLGISTPKLERLIAASIETGALGAKLNGSGAGGAMFAYAPGREKEVAAALEKAGGRAYIVGVDSGVRGTGRGTW